MNEKKVESKASEKDRNIQNQSSKEQITIMPTMIDESEEHVEKKKDLSAIIPKFEESIDENTTSLELISKDNSLKSDGSVSLGTIDSSGEIIINQNANLPEQIDIEQRKIEAQKNKTRKKKKEKIKPNKKAQKLQNTTALISIVIIAGLIGFVLWLKFSPSENNFSPLAVTVELGQKLPIRTSSYVKPGKGSYVDELLYTLDLSEVDISQVGVYPFTITYNNIRKNGTVSIVDTTPPELEVREVIITEGTSYNANSFVASCHDNSGCNYSFQDSETESKYINAGTYTVYVVATDAYQNSVTKKATLLIQTTGSLKSYSKEIPYDYNVGYEMTEIYELRFAEYDTYSLLINGTHIRKFKYQDNERYTEARATYAGEQNYTLDDSQMIITYTEPINYVGSNYTRLSDIENYLNREGYTHN